MSLRALFAAAASKRMKVQMHPTNPDICAIVCPVCGYGEGWLDQRVEGYTREPYDCPRCTLPAEPALQPEIQHHDRRNIG